MRNITLKKIILGLVAIFGLYFFWTYVNRYIFKPKAAQPLVNISLSPQSGTISLSGQTTIDVLVSPADAGNKISGLDLSFSTQGGISISQIGVASSYPDGNTSLFTEVIKTGTRISVVSLAPDTQLPSTVKIPVSLTGTAEGMASFHIGIAGSQVVGNIAGNVYDFGSVNQGNYTVSSTVGITPTGSPSQGPSVTVEVMPRSLTSELNQEFMTYLDIGQTPLNQHISGFDVSLEFDPSFLQVVTVGEPTVGIPAAPQTSQFTKIIKEVGVTPGKIRLGYVSLLPANQLPKQATVELRMRGVSLGVGDIRVVSAQVVGDIPQTNYLVNLFNSTVSVVPLGTISITPSNYPTPGGACQSNLDCHDSQECLQNRCQPVFCPMAGGLPGGMPQSECQTLVIQNHACTLINQPDGTACGFSGSCTGGVCIDSFPSGIPLPPSMTLNLRLKFQGILQSRADTFPVRVKLVAPDGSSETSTGTFRIADSQGTWVGSVDFFNLQPRAGYKLFIKGPKHLQKRICENTPSESFPATYHCETGNIALNPGLNDLDLTGIYLLVGDLPVQDGVVDSYDISLVRNNIVSSDPAVLSLADLNLDGVVDSQDYSLVIAALSLRTDEGE